MSTVGAAPEQRHFRHADRARRADWPFLAPEGLGQRYLALCKSELEASSVRRSGSTGSFSRRLDRPSLGIGG